jgi:hypothetical protein
MDQADPQAFLIERQRQPSRARRDAMLNSASGQRVLAETLVLY